MALSITVPPGADVRIAIRPPFHCLVAAPAPLAADLEALLNRPDVVAMFTFDPGVDWPDRDGCRWASAYLAAGHAVILQLHSLADALAAQKRLLASVAAP